MTMEKLDGKNYTPIFACDEILTIISRPSRMWASKFCSPLVKMMFRQLEERYPRRPFCLNEDARKLGRVIRRFPVCATLFYSTSFVSLRSI